MPERPIGFDQLGIGSVLSRHSLHVPINQREYAWESDHVTDLFQDLAKAIASNAPEYFLGTVVTIPTGPGVLEVVDGQQRLATTAILLAAIRNYLIGRKSDELIVADIDNQFLSVIDRAARERTSRLRLNVLDGVYFDRRIIHNETGIEPKAPSHRRIAAAADLAMDHVRNIVRPHDEKNHGDILAQWLAFIEHKAVVILLKVPSGGNAYRMFETLNDRGLKTSQADLVKNYLFGEARDREQEAQQKWGAMKALLESLGEEDLTVPFLRQMMISLYGYLREPDVYDKVQENARGATSSLQFLTLMESGAVDYVALLNPEHEKWNRYPPNARRAIETLTKIQVRPMRPLMLSIARHFDSEEAAKAFEFLVNMSVRLLIAGGTRSGSVEQAFAQAAKSITDGEITTRDKLKKSLEKSTPTDVEFEEQFRVATVSNASLARYYLRSLERSAKNEGYPYFIPNDDSQVINLEHVLPKMPLDNWPTFRVEEAEALYRRLGNMVLLEAKRNSDLRSAPFEEKKKAFLESPYELTRQIAELTEWTPKTVADRQSLLAKLAIKTWPV